MITFGHAAQYCSSTEDASPPLTNNPQQPARLIRFAEPIPYREAWSLQQKLHAERMAGASPDILLLLEHEPVCTMGRRTAAAHLGIGEGALRERGIALQPVNRGGSITYHGPGQLIGYPILRLSRYAPGPKTYVRLLEDVLIGTLDLWGIEGYRLEKNPGVWVRSRHGEEKIASIGIRVDHGVTLHGFALNVDLDLAPFSYIVPCGLAECRTTSLAKLRHTSISLDLVAEQVAEIFSRLFNVSFAPSRSALIERESSGRWHPHASERNPERPWHL